jgi:orotate phosphoribosyltransferase
MNNKWIAECLLDINAVFLSPDKLFTWASGIKSPVYCDNRVILSYPQVRKNIEDAFANLIQEKYVDCEVVAGTSTAGIPHAALVAERLFLPMIYVRSSYKNHGRNNLIEGRVIENQKVVVVEDLISTGGSVINVVNILRNANVNVIGVASIFTYGMSDSKLLFDSENIKNYSLVEYKTLLEVAIERKIINRDQLNKMMFF